MNELEFPEHSYDKLILLDTIYWVADFDKALASIVRLIGPGGKPGIFIANTPSMDDGPGECEPRGTFRCEFAVLGSIGLVFGMLAFVTGILRRR